MIDYENYYITMLYKICITSRDRCIIVMYNGRLFNADINILFISNLY